MKVRRILEGNLPPNIYKWIEENAHICTSVPTDRDTLVNFLTENEGIRCSLCPEIKGRQVPTSACAVETSFTLSGVEIGCHPIPELCLLELKTRYADFYFPDVPFNPEAESIFLATANPFVFERNNIGGGILTTKVPITMPVIIQSTVDLRSTDTTTTTPMPTTTTTTTSSPLKRVLPIRPIRPLNGFGRESQEFINPITSVIRNPLKIQKRINSKPCVDTHRLCCFWALAGECNSNPFWMRVRCPKTCGTCNCSMKEADKCVSSGVKCHITTTTTTTTTTTPRPTTTTSTTTTTTTTPAPTTTAAWVTVPSRQRPYGEHGAPTRRPPSYSRGMRPVLWPPLPTLYPPRTTTTTTKPPPTTTSTTTTTTTTTPIPTTTTAKTCFNYHELCSFWADLGECIKNPFWMRPHCQEACHSCGERLEDINIPHPRPNCKNHHKLCPFWTFIGECKNNPRWMLLHCRASCQVC
uniref:ShKT domain-containing protein n=1 Tax=Panagrolaimus sp. PS1159 TaxID=55785 RepID=A0AC35GTN3_9BILA